MFKSIGSAELLLCGAVVLILVVLAVVFLGGGLARWSAKRRRCPYCAESIKADATVCRYCGRDLPTTPEASEPPPE